MTVRNTVATTVTRGVALATPGAGAGGNSRRDRVHHDSGDTSLSPAGSGGELRNDGSEDVVLLAGVILSIPDSAATLGAESRFPSAPGQGAKLCSCQRPRRMPGPLRFASPIEAIHRAWRVRTPPALPARPQDHSLVDRRVQYRPCTHLHNPGRSSRTGSCTTHRVRTTTSTNSSTRRRRYSP